MKLVFICTFLFFIVRAVQAQQDPQYSQYMFNPLVINPAYAGCKDALNATLLLRNQWVGVDGAPKTQTFSIHTPLSKKKIGIGLHVLADQIGPRKNTGVFGSYSYKINLPKGKLSMGLRFGVFQYVYNWNSIEHFDQTDNVYFQNKTTYIVPSADFGTYYYNNDMYIGASVTHLFNGRITSVAVNGDNASFVPHVFVTAGKAFDITSSVLISPSLVVRTAQHAPVNFDINCNVLLQQKFWMGISYRSSHGIVIISQIVVTDRLRVGYSYDWGFSELDKLSTGTHEIMLGYDFSLLRKSRIVSPRYF